MARKVEEIEKDLAALSPKELEEFRVWYERFDAEVWDRQLEADVEGGKLEALASQAIADHEAGKSTKL